MLIRGSRGGLNIPVPGCLAIALRSVFLLPSVLAVYLTWKQIANKCGIANQSDRLLENTRPTTVLYRHTCVSNDRACCLSCAQLPVVAAIVSVILQEM